MGEVGSGAGPARTGRGGGQAAAGAGPGNGLPGVIGGSGQVGQPGPAEPLTRRLAGWEIFTVFAVSLGASGLTALVQFIGSLTGPAPLPHQHAVMNGSLAPGRPWLDFALQVTSTALSLAPVVLVLYLLARSGESPSAIGLDARCPGRDTVRGMAVAAVIGGTGLLLYLTAFHLGMNLNVVAEQLPAVWWRTPVLIASAAQNGILEETVVLGYLLHRLGQLGWPDRRAIIVSALVRGSYHLYQGFGGFIGNAAMGVIFGVLYRRWGRVVPLIVAHTLIDAVAFVGYAALHGRVSWLP